MFNEIDGDFNEMAIRVYKVGLPTEHDLRKSLTRKLVKSVHRLMDGINEYKWRSSSNRERGRLRWSLRTEWISG